MVKNKEKHNGIISIWKFIFSIMIILYHTNIRQYVGGKTLFRYGYIGAEFFFIVSGFLFMSSIDKKYYNVKNDELGKLTIKYIFDKLKKIFPHVFTSYIIGVIAFYLYGNVETSDLFNSIWDLLLLRMAGFQGLYVNTPIWYLSALYISMFIFFPLIVKYKENFCYIISPMIIMFGIGYLMHTNNFQLNMTGQWNGIIFYGLLRGIVELNIGIILYHIHKNLKKVKYTKFGCILLTLIQLFCFSSVVLITALLKNSYRYDYIMLLLLSIGILIAFSTKTFDYNICCNKFFYFLEKYSTAIYVFHWPIRKIIYSNKYVNKLNYINSTLIYVSVILVVSLILMLIIDYISKKCITKKIKKLIVHSS